MIDYSAQPAILNAHHLQGVAPLALGAFLQGVFFFC